MRFIIRAAPVSSRSPLKLLEGIKVLADASSGCSTEWFKKKMGREVCEVLYTRQLKPAKEEDKYPPSFKMKVPFYDGVWKCGAYTQDEHTTHVEGDLSEIVSGKCRVRVLVKCHGWLTAAGMSLYVFLMSCDHHRSCQAIHNS